MKNTSIKHADSIPIIKLWGNLLVPLQGEVSDSQAERLQRELLQRIRSTDVEGVVVDVSGVSVMDSHFCRLLANLTSAAELMGVTSVLCGLRPEIVMTLQAMDIDLADMEPALSLEEALERVGLTVQRSSRTHHDVEAFDDDETVSDASPTRKTIRGEKPWIWK